MVAMTFAILNTWICLAGSLSLVLPSGGSVAFLYGFIFCVLCNFCLAASLGELAAIWPTAGGQYHFQWALTSEKWRKVMSFAVGYINIFGWLTLVTTEGFFAAQFISAACVVASDGTYTVAAWKTYLIFMVVLTFGTLSMTFGNRILGAWNNLALYWSILSVFVASVVLLSTSDKTDPEFVFATFQNETGWNDGIAWILGLLQSALSLIGYDAVLHMTEEMPTPSRDAPLAMVYAVGVGGTTGTIFILDRQGNDTTWKFGKVRGLIINYIAVLYVFITSIFFCFPPVLPVTASLMNYVSAVIGIFAIFLIGYWVLYGKKTFQGPELDIILGERFDLSEATDELAMEEKNIATRKQEVDGNGE
ncbi:unnamed protein product [Fusarium langsethiae]|nr:unnamed protein product [Fusarium langsethiae]